MPLEHSESFARLAAGDLHDVVKAFAANPAFRAAEWEELTTEDNPYRRPVRPDDLAWLDYGKQMPVAKALKLSALLGHRMLRNVYDSGLLYLPPAGGQSGPAATDAATFYSDENRVLGALASPVLEQHLFGLLESEREQLAGYGPEQVVAAVEAYHRQRSAESGQAFVTALSTKDRKASATFVLLQLSAYLPASRMAAGRAALGEYDVEHPGARITLLDDYRTWAGLHDEYRSLVEGAGLRTTTGAYWQLYLGTSLARGNHLHWLSRNREKYPEFLGALLHHSIDQSVTAARFADVFEDGLGVRSTLFDHLGGDPGHLRELADRWVTPLSRLYGPAAVERFHHGFADAAWLARLWDEDLARQLAWADDIPLHQEKAEKISRYIDDNDITVDLDTFVESNEETSTTHVHDEHRLVMIEKGEMHFWNNVTHKIDLHEGDKVLIPVSRLHGSTVLSGECTYHQPIIPEEMYARF
ncbi:peptide synthetase [Streptomyces sp. CBMA29]|uniref:peptide synthetase n=1 Tax=Streptomyces sp. CBMA29 TaxID=1896314 RepID=UPI001661EEEC|nr:peptide synthetase [Streptomyces sp. CBMA29]MBD0740654.1 peptide synthetase [Streptomyces sp. CBMA29]